MGILAQNNDSTNKILLIDSEGASINLDIDQITGPVLLVVYGPGCGVCFRELQAISKKIESWEKLYNVKLIAFSRKYKKDYGRQISRTKEKAGLNIPLYIDVNGDLTNYVYNASGIDTLSFSKINGLHLMVPQTVILAKDKKVVFQKQGYQAGDEEKIEAILKEL